MKKLMYSAAGLLVATHANVAQAGIVIDGRWEEALQWGTVALDVQVATWINLLTSFLTLIAVIYAIWGWFLILTAAGDEEKVKKGRTVIFHAILGLIVIWLAYSIIVWVVSLLQTWQPGI